MPNSSSAPVASRSLRFSFCAPLLLSLGVSTGVPISAQQPLVIDARHPPEEPKPVHAALGTHVRPDGQTLTANSQYLVLNGRPWLPVMGEFHYSRVPREDWEAEILKMKAGGVQIISTYIIWLHQEELEGEFDWTGRRDLRAFVALCAKHGMYVYPRIGPWAHGEARNGGLPDWVLAHGPTRRNDPVYLAEVTRLFDQIGQQLRGDLWKDGGPVVGIQLENEYRGDGTPGTGAEHIRTLKQIAVAAGLDVPLYTVTGWDGAAIPLDAVLPVYGGYPDAPWDGSPVKLPPNEVYAFRTENRVGGNMGIIGGAGQNSASAYAGTPFLTAELGGGMQDTYFRRPVVSADDIAAMPAVLLGSGANLLGFYMFQGGRNPEGKRTTLQESQVTGYPTDVPVKSYDFQAPLGEFGTERPSFRRLKLVNYFLNDFGDLLAPMSPSFPDVTPASPADLSVPRVAARTSANRGFIFFNNHLRGATMPARRSFSVSLKLAGGDVRVPASPIDLPSDAYGIWPVNLTLGEGLNLRYSTAQLFHTFMLGTDRYVCFFTLPGVVSEFAVDTVSKPVTLNPGFAARTQQGVTYLRAQSPASPIEAVFDTGPVKTHLLLLSRDQAERMWRVPGQSAPLLTSAQFYADEHSATLQAEDDPNITLSLFTSSPVPVASTTLTRKSDSPLLQTYTAHLTRVSLKADLTPVSPGSTRSPLQSGPVFAWRKRSVPLAPADPEFQHAASWSLSLPTLKPDVADARITIHYRGDIARIRTGNRLVDDDFWNGQPWTLSLNDLTREGVGREATLQVLGWPKDPPMYLEAPLSAGDRAGDLPATPSVSITPEYQLVVHLPPSSAVNVQ